MHVPLRTRRRITKTAAAAAKALPVGCLPPALLQGGRAMEAAFGRCLCI